MNLQDGRYVGRATEINISKTKSGNPQVCVKFQIDVGIETKDMLWFGSLKQGKPFEFTLKALITAGLEEQICALSESKEFTLTNGKDVSLVLETEEFNGKAYQKIKWINDLSSNEVFKNKIEKGEMAQIFNGINLREEFKAMKLAQNQQGDFAPNEEVGF